MIRRYGCPSLFVVLAAGIARADPAPALPSGAVARLAPAIRVVWSPDGKRLATGATDECVRLWEAAGWRQSHSLVGLNGAVEGLAFAPDSLTIASSSGMDPNIHLWDVVAGKSVRTMRGGNAGINDVAFSPDGRILASASADKALRLWDPRTGRLLRTEQPIQTVGRLAFAPDGKTMAGLYDGLKTVQFWSVDADSPSPRPVTTPGHESLWSLSYSPDGSRLALCGKRPSVDLWNPVTRTTVRRLAWEAVKPPPSSIEQCRCAFSPDGKLLAVAGSDSVIRLWELGTHQQILRFEGHRGQTVDVAFAPDGLTLASASEGDAALVWDMTLKSGGFPDLEDAALWDELASPNAALAYRAVCALAAEPGRAVKLLRAKLSGHEDRGVRVRQLIADLDSPRFAERERATKELARMDVEADLRAALAGPVSPEVRRRAEGVLNKLSDAGLPPEAARLGRAVMVLERVNSPASRKLLEEVSAGEAGLDAKAALDRLARRDGR
jgi:Tol biopolymer transport system component